MTAYTQINTRFWAWINGDWVKLTMSPDQVLRWGYHAPDEEGYSFAYYVWERDGAQVRLSIDSGGRDCDGYICNSVDLVCHVGSMTAVRHGGVDYPAECLGTPQWERESESVYDQFAQAANY